MKPFMQTEFFFVSGRTSHRNKIHLCSLEDRLGPKQAGLMPGKMKFPIYIHRKCHVANNWRKWGEEKGGGGEGREAPSYALSL